MTKAQKARIRADLTTTYDFNGGEDIRDLLAELDKARADLDVAFRTGDLRAVASARATLQGLP